MDIKLPPAGSPGPTAPGSAPAQSPLAQLPKDMLLAAQVLSSMPASTRQTGTAGFDTLLQLGNQQILTRSHQPFSTGQRLEVLVTASNALKIVAIHPGTAAQDPRQLTLQQGLRQVLPLQQSTALLLANLPALQQVLQSTRQAEAARQVREILSSLPRFADLARPARLKQAITHSGLFFETRLKQLTPLLAQFLPPAAGERSAASHNQRPQTAAGTVTNAPPAPAGDVQHNLREAVRATLQDNPTVRHQVSQLLDNDFKAQLLKLSRILLPLLGNTGAALINAPPETPLLERIARILPSTQGADTAPADKLPRLPNLPITTLLENLLAQRPASAAPGPTGNAGQSPGDLAIATVLRQLAAGLAQLQANQLHSLAASRSDGDGTALLNSWQLEIPTLLANQYKPIQLQIHEELPGHSHAAENETRRVWKVTLSFDLETLGEFFATLRIVDHSISATFWSDRPDTLERISHDLERLHTSLAGLGLTVDELDCRQGRPAMRETRLEQQLVDITT